MARNGAQLAGRSVLVTGGASGLGLAFARTAAKQGAYITIADIQPAEQEVEELTAQGYQVQSQICDTTDWEQQILAFQKAIAFSKDGELDVVAVFAGVDDLSNLIQHVQSSTHSDQPPARPSVKCLNVNLEGALYTTTLALHYLGTPSAKDGRDKSLVFIASLAGYADDTHNPIYTASKFGVRGLFRSIRGAAHEQMGVRCNLIAPYAIRTPMTAPILKVMEEHGIREGKGISFATPETLVEATMQCISDTSLVGRAFAVMPEGYFDLGDDFDGGYGGDVLKQMMERRRAAGDLMRE